MSPSTRCSDALGVPRSAGSRQRSVTWGLSPRRDRHRLLSDGAEGRGTQDKPRSLPTPSLPHTFHRLFPTFSLSVIFILFFFPSLKNPRLPACWCKQSDSHPVSALGAFLVLLHPQCGGDGFRCGRTVALYIATLPRSHLSFS